MDSGHIVMLWGKGKGQKALFRILSATGAEIRYCSELAPDDLHSCRLIVIDYDALHETAPQILETINAHEANPPVLIVTKNGGRDDLVSLLSNNALTNLFVKNSDITAREMIVTVQKIMSENSDIFGIEKYLTFGVRPIDSIVRTSDTSSHLDELEAYLGNIGVNSRLVGLARSVADEFLMNAIYSAPVDESGKPKYLEHPRNELLELEESEFLRFRFGSDGHHLAISVEDRFGRLTKETLLSYLHRCFRGNAEQIEHKSAGAGLGFFQAFQSLNHLIVNVRKNERTELIGTLDVSGTYKTFAEKAKSLHIFLAENQQ